MIIEYKSNAVKIHTHFSSLLTRFSKSFRATLIFKGKSSKFVKALSNFSISKKVKSI